MTDVDRRLAASRDESDGLIGIIADGDDTPPVDGAS
jgi:hypothetical protein